MDWLLLMVLAASAAWVFMMLYLCRVVRTTPAGAHRAPGTNTAADAAIARLMVTIPATPRLKDAASTAPAAPRWRPDLTRDVVPYRLKELEATVAKLPRLPTMNLQIAAAAASLDTEPERLARLVSADPALASRLLKVANSAAVGGRGKVSDVHRAILLLGYAEVRAVALASGCDAAGWKLNTVGCAKPIWHHSFAASVAAFEIARQQRGSVAPGLAGTAALLHDIGRMALGVLKEKEFLQLERMPASEDSEDRLRLEQELLGANHAVIGAAVARSWNLSAELTALIERHCLCFFRSPADMPSDYREALSIVHAADLLTHVSVDDGSEHQSAHSTFFEDKGYLSRLCTPELIDRMKRAGALARSM